MNFSIEEILATIFLLVGFLSLIITYFVHQSQFTKSFIGGFWFSNVCICLGIITLLIILFVNSCKTDN